MDVLHARKKAGNEEKEIQASPSRLIDGIPRSSF
jgi:hypothetical protein